MEPGTEYDRGLLWISITRNSGSILKVKVHHALGLRSSGNVGNIQESRVTIQMLSGPSRTNLFTVAAKSIQHRHFNITSILKYNGVFHLNAPFAELCRKRLMFSVYIKGSDETKAEELAGCFSLGVRSLIIDTNLDSKLVNGWCFLLQPEQGKTENVMVLVDSPKSLLRDMEKGHRKGCDVRGEFFENDGDLIIPISDGSVCRGHNIEGQLETDVDAAFCCLVEDNCSNFGKMHILDDTVCSKDRSACQLSINQSFDQQSRERLENISAHSTLSSVESAERSMSFGHYGRDPPETPFRHRNNTVLLRGRRKLAAESLYGLRRQLEFENPSADNHNMKMGLNNVNDRQEIGLHKDDDQCRGLKRHVGERSTTTCCDTSRLIEAFKVRVKKVKLQKDAKDSQKIELKQTRNNVQLQINQKTVHEKRVEDLHVAERDFQNFLFTAESLYLHQKAWNEHRNKREFLPRDILEDFGIVSPLEASECDILSPSQIKNSATSTPFLKDNRIRLMAVQRRVIGFHRYSQRQELGFSLAEVSGTGPNSSAHNSSSQIMNDYINGCCRTSTRVSTSRDGPESIIEINDDCSRVNSCNRSCNNSYGDESSYIHGLSDMSRDFCYFPESLTDSSHSTLSVCSTQEFSRYSPSDRLFSNGINGPGNENSANHLDLSHQYVNRGFVSGSMNTSHSFPTPSSPGVIDIDDSRLSCGIISVGDTSRQLTRDIIPGYRPWSRDGQGSANDEERMSTSGSSGSFSSASSCSCRSGCSSNSSNCIASQSYYSHQNISQRRDSHSQSGHFIVSHVNNSHCIPLHSDGTHLIDSRSTDIQCTAGHSSRSNGRRSAFFESSENTNHSSRCRVVVSKVAANSLASDWDLAPGDGIVAINHVDVSGMTCGQVVRMLRDACKDVMLEVERVTHVYLLD